MSFRSAYGYAESEAGWRMCNDDECDKDPVPGTDVRLLIRCGIPNTILKAFAARFNELVEPLDQTQCGGWARDSDVATSNHLAGTAMDLNWNRHPFHQKDTFGAGLPALKKILEEFRGCVFWGGDWTDSIDEMHFQLNHPEGHLDSDGNFVEKPDRRLVDLANDLNNGYLGIWKSPGRHAKS